MPHTRPVITISCSYNGQTATALLCKDLWVRAPVPLPEYCSTQEMSQSLLTSRYCCCAHCGVCIPHHTHHECFNDISGGFRKLEKKGESTHRKTQLINYPRAAFIHIFAADTCEIPLPRSLTLSTNNDFAVDQKGSDRLYQCRH